MDSYYVIFATVIVIYIYLLYFTVKNIVNAPEISMRIVVYNIMALLAHVAGYSVLSFITGGRGSDPLFLIFFTAISYFVYVYYSLTKIKS